jgi:hypothetical protein
MMRWGKNAETLGISITRALTDRKFAGVLAQDSLLLLKIDKYLYATNTFAMIEQLSGCVFVEKQV